MNCILKMKQSYPRFTPKEKKVADFILCDPQNVTDLSVKMLAEQAGSSTGAVIRLFKKLDYESYHQMKLDIARADMHEEKPESFIINEGDTVGMMAKKLESRINEAVSGVVSTFNFKKLEAALQKLQNAPCIYLLGMGSSAFVAMDLHQKLMRLNRRAVFHQDSHTQIATSVYAQEEDVAIAFSYSGETREVNLAAQNAKDNGAFLIGVTKSAPSTLANLCDFPCFLPNNESEIRLGAIESRYAEIFMSDLFYLAITQKDFQKTKENITKTRAAVKAVR